MEVLEWELVRKEIYLVLAEVAKSTKTAVSINQMIRICTIYQRCPKYSFKHLKQLE